MKDTTKKRLPYIIGGILIGLTLFLAGFAIAKTTGHDRGMDMGRRMEMKDDGYGRRASMKEGRRVVVGDLEIAVRKANVEDDELTVTIEIDNEGTDDIKLSDVITKITAKQNDKDLTVKSGAWNSDNDLYDTTLKADKDDSFEMVVKLDNTDDDVEITFASADSSESITVPASRVMEREDRARAEKADASTDATTNSTSTTEKTDSAAV